MNHIVLPDLEPWPDLVSLHPTPAGDPPPSSSVHHSRGPHSEIPTRDHPSSWSLQTFLGYDRGPQGNVSPWGQSHPHPLPDPVRPGFPLSTICKHLSNRCSKLKSDDTREIPSKPINHFTNTRQYYQLKENPSSMPSGDPRAHSSPRQPSPAQRSSAQLRQHPPENFCSRLPEASLTPNSQIPKSQSFRAEGTRSNPHVPFPRGKRGPRVGKRVLHSHTASQRPSQGTEPWPDACPLHSLRKSFPA